ncbi:MAG: glycerol kinase GlpK [Akkermansiaceae bacterium]|nr:glycerol kinase GlpK [Akkermansiaceae bacterium]
MSHILALDQGTTSSRAILFNQKGEILGVEQEEFTQIYPQSGWVEHDPEEIWSTQESVMKRLMEATGIAASDIDAIGITNQRETAVVWNGETGEAIHKAIVWQDKRTSDLCEELKAKGLEDLVRDKTGLVIDSYFSATKIHWILENVDGARQLADAGKLRFGTIDSWLIWKMTGGRSHLTDHTNASRTLLYNIPELKWDEELLAEFGIPASMLPEVQPSSSDFGSYCRDDVEIPILGVAGDQQAALFGQACTGPGEAKNTYGTGCFLLMHLGSEAKRSEHGLLTTLACSPDGSPAYALEGSIFIAGAVVQWLRDALQVIDQAADSETCAREVESDEVVLVPSFAGLGAPYWDQYSRGAIFGLTRDSGKNHITRAALQSIAFQTRDVLEAMEQDSGIEVEVLNVDGGATHNDYLMQFQADILGKNVDRPVITESTALGAAYLAGLQAGVWQPEDLKRVRRTDREFSPTMDEQKRNQLYRKWKKAVERTLNWAKD